MALSRLARRRVSGSSLQESTAILAPGATARTSGRAWRPPTAGMARSSRTRSGWSVGEAVVPAVVRLGNACLGGTRVASLGADEHLRKLLSSAQVRDIAPGLLLC